ncbi:5'-3' deoxyribonucleotidase [Rhizobium phage vB_RleM_P10VF]|uniref:Uncharacterized protein n=1 Tax=Rhizobium phage vB_RleM_P10VF TaxID=1527770 RepID=A0A076YKA2_9CAUD|nr:5'-3' deoxyribonucleotidase [Rhizobium phage vB_RleM_P10VF]AIK68217.1 hypothetical protein P10VF_004 [Rhizobium phage vB_RleM_P10VF]
MTTINLDLDGVFFDFERHYYDTFGIAAKDEDDNILNKKIKKHGNFFAELPLFDGAVKFLDDLKRYVDDLNFESRHIKPVAYDLKFLSACGRSDFENVAQQKIKAVRAKLNDDLHLTFSPAGKQKYLYLRYKGDVLIDDFKKNLIPWVEAGGRAIQHEGDYNATLQTLKLVLGKTVSNRSPGYDTFNQDLIKDVVLDYFKG